MKPFLYQIADRFYQEYGSGISRLAFVFPNRRAGLFFQKYLSEIAGRPLFSPKIMTINDLFVQLSGKQQADRISMLFKLFDIYKQVSGSLESFDDFLYWGEMLLNDFNDIDTYMANAEKLFRNLSDLKQLDDGYDFLDETQIEAIRSFWSTFSPTSDPNKANFLKLWEVLSPLYNGLREVLAGEGCGYGGMIFRDVVERLESGELNMAFPYDQIVFVGLNALSISEKRLLDILQREGIADFYWDYDSPYVRDPHNKASFFVQYNIAHYPSKLQLPPQEKVEQTIKVVGVPSAIGEAKQVYHLLKRYADAEPMTPDSALRTAVVLPDETLLIPVLDSIPQEIAPINVTMGYPLAGTPVASLMDYILRLHKNMRYVNTKPYYYHRDVLPILRHQYIAATCPEEVSSLEDDIVSHNRIFIAAEELCQGPFFTTLFHPVENVAEMSEYLIHLLELLSNQLMHSAEDGGEQPTAEEENIQKRQTLVDIEQEFVFHYYATVNRMKEIMQGTNVEMQLDTYFRLLKRMTDLITIPFEGEPLSGLQVMGVLETRALDFDRLILLSMNEQIFPMKKAANSFIPYNLRRGFGLPTYEHQDSVWAYHFYRLIHRAKEVTLLYDTRNSSLQGGEVSRFVHQLRYHYRVPLVDQLVVYSVASSKPSPIIVAKDDVILEKLNQFMEGGSRYLSASSINDYAACPLKFYYSTVENIREEDEVSESIESNTLGSIIHRVMEVLYTPFKGKMITADLLRKIQKDNSLLTDTIERAFAQIYFKTAEVRPLEGVNFLTGELVRKYIIRILEKDCEYTPFTFVEAEKEFRVAFSLSDERKVQIKGIIDRIDEKDQSLRIVDYKSGDGETSFKTLESLFEKEKSKLKAIRQVFLYAWAYKEKNPNEKKPIQMALYFLRKSYTKFEPEISIKGSKKEKIEDFQEYREPFENQLRVWMDEIFDANVPFAQSKTDESCEYCRFVSLCGRKKK